jgi:CheY-like chemotaxis protein
VRNTLRTLHRYAHLVAADGGIPVVHIVVLNENPPADTHDGPTYLPKPVHRSALYDLLAQSMVTVVPVPVTTTGGHTPVTATRGKVLLVEDNDINQMVAIGILTGLGYEADVAGDGARACDLAADNDYDVILMDCRMPRMDGFTATCEMRQREQHDGGHTPIIAMTASALVADRDRCLAAGMDDYLSKPVNPAELEAALHRWITHPVPHEPVSPATTTPERTDGCQHGDDSIGRRLDELAGDRSEPELAPGTPAGHVVPRAGRRTTSPR